MRFEKFLLIKSDVFVEELNTCELLDLYEKKSHKTIHSFSFKNLFGSDIKRYIPSETLPEFCKRMNIIKNPMWEKPNKIKKD
jgi:hypothetical protein